MTRPRIGFLGTGWIGRHRMAAMLATGAIEPAAIVEPSPDNAAEARTLAPQAAMAESLEEMLAMRLDGIVIATPSALHAAQAVQALAAGAAVFCQKPLGRTAAEAELAVAAAARADRLLGVDLSYRFTSGMQAIAGLVRDGTLGHVHAIDLVFHNAYGPDKAWFYDPALSGGGCVMDLGVHLVDLALWMLDFPAVTEVIAHLSAGGAPPATGQVEDFAVATLTLAGGTIVRLACSWKLHAGQDAAIRVGVYGTQGGAELANVTGSFYDLAAHRFTGTSREVLALPPEDWGGRAAADWARRLAAGERYDPAAERLIEVAAVLDRIYAR